MNNVIPQEIQNKLAALAINFKFKSMQQEITFEEINQLMVDTIHIYIETIEIFKNETKN